jgi:phage shock protein PspC (stress-responsive transcriptional regulator)
MVAADADADDGAMTETDERPTPGPRPAEGPRVDPRRQLHDIEGLHRSRTDRKVAGVAGGLARHFDVDPTIFRVLFAATTFFGGAGLVVYAVLWLFVPEDGSDRAVIHVSAELRRVFLLAALVVGGLLLFGDAWGGFHGGWPFGLVAVALAVVLIVRDRRPVTTVGPPAMTGTGTIDPAGGPAPTADVDAVDEAGSDAPPPAWQPPIAYVPPSPPRPRRTGVIWFLPTLALVAIGLGILGLVDRTAAVPAAAYPALALAIVGAMLVVGAFVGRPGGLIFLGLVAALALGVTSAVGNGFSTHGRTINATPTSAAAVAPAYFTSTGRIVLDLSQVADPSGLAGRTVRVHLKAGEAVVTLPPGVNVVVNGTVRVAGQVDIGVDSNGGVGTTTLTHVFENGPVGQAPLTIDASTRLGHVQVDEE